MIVSNNCDCIFYINFDSWYQCLTKSICCLAVAFLLYHWYSDILIRGEIFYKIFVVQFLNLYASIFFYLSNTHLACLITLTVRCVQQLDGRFNSLVPPNATTIHVSKWSAIVARLLPRRLAFTTKINYFQILY